MSPRGVSLLVLSGALAAVACAALALAPRPAPAAQVLPAAPRATSRAIAAVASGPGPLADEPAVTRFERLPALHIVNEASRESADIKLYDAAGNIDEAAAQRLDALLCDARKPKQHETTTLQRRTLQLLFKAAYHFHASEVEVVSAYRKPGRRREGPHGTGSAIDFRLSGVEARELAAYLRRIPRTGVGIYTHPKTQYVHLDSREHSFHWLDASPPRRHWREKSIGAPDLPQLDDSYRPEQDLP
ncbi:MAG TPA: DUF882 domain-containing protein [Polyangiaceae bacterium]|nr:DUF882 domain-containing protein [Polyangiaceae bacterium]